MRFRKNLASSNNRSLRGFYVAKIIGKEKGGVDYENLSSSTEWNWEMDWVKQSRFKFGTSHHEFGKCWYPRLLGCGFDTERPGWGPLIKS